MVKFQPSWVIHQSRSGSANWLHTVSQQRVGPIVGKGSFARKPSTPALAAQIAKVEIDPETGRIKVLKMAASQDVGFAINPMAVEGQIEGGAVQGYAWATMEEMQYNEEGNVNPGFVDYRVPTTADLPTVESVIVEVEAPDGPLWREGCR